MPDEPIFYWSRTPMGRWMPVKSVIPPGKQAKLLRPPVTLTKDQWDWSLQRCAEEWPVTPPGSGDAEPEPAPVEPPPPPPLTPAGVAIKEAIATLHAAKERLAVNNYDGEEDQWIGDCENAIAGLEAI